MKTIPGRWTKMCLKLFKIVQWIIGITLLPLILTVLALLFTWKNILLKTSVKFLKPKFLSLLNSRDGLYAVDRFWEESHSSLGLIAILNGNVCIDKLREEFTKKVLQATDPTQPEIKIFTRFLQIPISFGGYYFWQKANYFLIHEHIRQIDQPIDEAGLKKFAGTVMTLPFPNKRPLWEILVFPSFNTNCSAIVIRIHRTLMDPEGLMHLIAAFSNGEIKQSYKHQTAAEVTSGNKPTALDKIRDAFKMPVSVYNFCTLLLKFSCGEGTSSFNDGEGVAGWKEMHELSFRKIQKTQNLEYSSTVGISVLLASVTNSMRLSSAPPKSSTDPEPDTKNSEGIERSSGLGYFTSGSILLPLQSFKKSNEILTNSEGLAVIEIDKTLESNSISRLKQIDLAIKSSIDSKYPEISLGLLKILSLLPRHLLRYVISRCLVGGLIIYQDFPSEITTASKASSFEAEMSESAESALDLISIGHHALLELVPLCGLQWNQWNHAVSVATVKFQDQVTMSLLVNGGLFKLSEKQKAVDDLIENIPEELDKIFEDGQDEQGFISIPII